MLKCSPISTIRWAQSNCILQHTHTHTHINWFERNPPPSPLPTVRTVHSLWTGPKKCGSILGRGKLVLHFPKTSGAVSWHAVATLLYKTVKVKFNLEQPKKAQRGGKVYRYSFFNLGTRWDVWSKRRRGHFSSGKETRYLLYRRLFGQVRKISSLTRIRPPGRPARSQSLCRLRYPSPYPYFKEY